MTLLKTLMETPAKSLAKTLGRAAVVLAAATLPAAAAAAQTPAPGAQAGQAQGQSSALSSAASTDGLNRRVRVHNQTGLELRILQAADVRTGRSGENLLAGTPLPAGDDRALTIDVGTNVCVFDLRAELSSGQVLNRAAVNVCRIADLYLTR